MPVESTAVFSQIDQGTFQELDFQVMRVAFDIHNEFGRLCDEHIYREELAERCRRNLGETVQTEVPLTVTYRDFSKHYYIDMLVGRGGLYELKTMKTITPDHKNQALNYLLLADLCHGKIVNFRPVSVQHQFVSTTLHLEERRRVRIERDLLNEGDERAAWFADTLESLVDDWGGSLSLGLYNEAINYFLGGDRALSQIDILSADTTVGKQQAHMLGDDSTYRITALSSNRSSYKKHLQKWLSHTRLKSLHWANIDRKSLFFESLIN